MPPRLQECDGDNILRISGYGDQPVGVATDAVLVSIEDAGKRLAISGEYERPVFCFHTM
jgi:hypothetical protein